MDDKDSDLSELTGLANLPAELFDAAGEIYDRTKKAMWSLVKYKELKMMYACAIKEVQTKFDVLDTEFNVRHRRNPINSVSSRIKSTQSIIAKLLRKKLPVTPESMETNIYDIAGIRVVCSYIDDIYAIADALLAQDDIELVARKDYIKAPKPNGYRSLHLIVRVPVFFAETKKKVNVEVQIRTIAMDFWASLEHQLKYKKDIPDQQEIVARLKACADVITQTDEKMLGLRRQIESAEDMPTEEDILFEKLGKLDIQL